MPFKLALMEPAWNAWAAVGLIESQRIQGDDRAAKLTMRDKRGMGVTEVAEDTPGSCASKLLKSRSRTGSRPDRSSIRTPYSHSVMRVSFGAVDRPSPRCQYVISPKRSSFHMRRKGEGSPQERFASSIAPVAAAKPQMEFIQFAVPSSELAPTADGFVGCSSFSSPTGVSRLTRLWDKAPPTRVLSRDKDRTMHSSSQLNPRCRRYWIPTRCPVLPSP